jgi:hypothetical protein
MRRANEKGNPIYAVFEPAGTTQSEVCDAVRAAGGGAYGKWLDLLGLVFGDVGKLMVCAIANSPYLRRKRLTRVCDDSLAKKVPLSVNLG